YYRPSLLTRIVPIAIEHRVRTRWPFHETAITPLRSPQAEPGRGREAVARKYRRRPQPQATAGGHGAQPPPGRDGAHQLMPPGAEKKGSSPNSGEGSADLEEEILLVAIAVSPALDDLDGVVDALDDAGVEWMPTAGQDSVHVRTEALREQGQGGHAAASRLLEPVLPSSPRPALTAVEPQAFELVVMTQQF